MWAYACHNMHTQVTGQLLGTGSLLPEFHSFNRSNKVASPKNKNNRGFQHGLDGTAKFKGCGKDQWTAKKGGWADHERERGRKVTVTKAAALHCGEWLPEENTDTLPPMHVPLKTPLLTSVPVFQRQDNYKLQVGLYGKILSQAKQNTTRLPNFPYLQLDTNGVILFVFLRTAFPQQHAILSFTPISVTKLGLRYYLNFPDHNFNMHNFIIAWTRPWLWFPLLQNLSIHFSDTGQATEHTCRLSYLGSQGKDFLNPGLGVSLGNILRSHPCPLPTSLPHPQSPLETGWTFHAEDDFELILPTLPPKCWVTGMCRHIWLEMI